MNQFLAELYNTNDTIGTSSNADVEKLAQAEVVDQLLKSEGLTVDDVDAATILKVAGDLFGPDNAIQKAAEEAAAAHEGGETPAEETEEEKAKKAKEKADESPEEKMAQADFLGRQMAHAYVNELSNIEKNAGMLDTYRAAREGGAGLYHSLKGTARATGHDVSEAVKGFGSKQKERIGEGVKGVREAATGKGSMGTGEMNKKDRLKSLGYAAKKLAPELAVGTTGLTAGGVGLHHALKGKKKESSAIDTLAEKRAYQILAENGLLTETDPVQEKLAATVEERAWQMLAQAGYVK